MVKVDLIAAARPNFMKVAPLYHVLQAESAWCRARLVHTGQHYDANMSDAFFTDLRLPAPHRHLGIGSGSHAEQTAGVMVAYEKACMEDRPDWVIVVGDVNSTLACALAATKLGIRVAHLEAGLRSRDRGMPEEINRIIADAVADVLWTPSRDADQNLRDEGIGAEKIECVGNIMIDSLEMMRSAIERRQFFKQLNVEPRGYGVMTLHRPSNVDDRHRLTQLCEMTLRITQRIPMVFPVHPRTRQRLEEFGLWQSFSRQSGLFLIAPVGYVDFMSLVFNARFALTDSGGIQEETTYLGIPCLTLRETTERPITITDGTNRLVKIEDVAPATIAILEGRWAKGRVPELWDGQTAGRVAMSLKRRQGFQQG